ncbi:MAG: bifunctional 4-hydroxy-2-oxoglutarate aldolase/2-dehydro-3-deoxy-phosphogluconate aldolase [Spirochaetaceae bacterium]|nr:bifunctional 4-hydroxy-2-oxoglutarate aldolase/2-dehydro-3-deoxy-phosphogluconate aldolase [Spirochaetaceae bacterium]
MAENKRERAKERIAKTYLVPVVVLDDVETAVDTAKALLAGGIDVMEITLRTEAGLPSIERVRREVPGMLVGAGTVITPVQCRLAIEAGAEFIVSPGLEKDVVETSGYRGVLLIPGCVTPTEILAALKAKLDVVKFFPAHVYGGIKAIKALAGPFPMVKFVPTGGIDFGNLSSYIDKSVFAVGGGWLCDKKMIETGNFAELTAVAADAVAIVKNHVR